MEDGERVCERVRKKSGVCAEAIVCGVFGEMITGELFAFVLHAIEEEVCHDALCMCMRIVCLIITKRVNISKGWIRSTSTSNCQPFTIIQLSLSWCLFFVQSINIRRD